MLSFKVYLKESTEDSSGNPNDDKGKLHELLLAKHLNKGKLPEHHRAHSDNPEHSGTPEQVHDKLKKKMGEHEYNQVEQHAKQTAAAVHEHLKKHGIVPKGHVLHSVHWTSNRDTEKKAGDHEKTTGVKDTNSNADLIVTHKHPKTGEVHHVGVSAKYGKHEPNYKNAGLDSLEKQADHKKGTYTNMQKKHESHMETLGYKGAQTERHKQYKEDKKHLEAEQKAHKESETKSEFKPKSKEAKRAHAAEESSRVTRTAMARKHEQGLAKKSDSELRTHIANQVSPPTVHHHVVAHSQTKDNGSADSHVSNAHDVAHEHLSKFRDLHVKKGDGITATIHGTYHNPGHKDHGKVKPVASQIFKASSGPHKGTAGAFKLH